MIKPFFTYGNIEYIKIGDNISDKQWLKKIFYLCSNASHNDCFIWIIDSSGGDLDIAISISEAITKSKGIHISHLKKVHSASCFIALSTQIYKIEDDAKMYFHKITNILNKDVYNEDIVLRHRIIFLLKDFLTLTEIHNIFSIKNELYLNKKEIMKRLNYKVTYENFLT